MEDDDVAPAHPHQLPVAAAQRLGVPADDPGVPSATTLLLNVIGLPVVWSKTVVGVTTPIVLEITRGPAVYTNGATKALKSWLPLVWFALPLRFEANAV